MTPKVCPMCGSKNINIEIIADKLSSMLIGKKVYQYHCNECNLVKGRYANTKQMALEYWNTRPNEQRLEKKIAILNERINKLENK